MHLFKIKVVVGHLYLAVFGFVTHDLLFILIFPIVFCIYQAVLGIKIVYIAL